MSVFEIEYEYKDEYLGDHNGRLLLLAKDFDAAQSFYDMWKEGHYVHPEFCKVKSTVELYTEGRGRILHYSVTS